MSTLSENTKSLVGSAHRVVVHQQEIKRLKGENFNVFSILKMESYENETHSAFIRELLDPAGSHFYGDIFLKLFLETVGYKGLLNVETASVHLEKHIGWRDDVEKSGGRVDIYIADAAGNTICIENKIYAGDQSVQIERYVNHNKDKNTVYYLTLFGDEASKESKGELHEEFDYTCISYKSTILHWLERCLKEAAEQAILRESIRQYAILIRKLTDQLSDSKMEKDIENIIRCNYPAAKLLASSISKLEVNATHDFLLEVKAIIESQLQTGWKVSVDDDLSQSWTGLRVTRAEWSGIEIKLEGFSKMPWGNNYYGIVAPEDQFDRSLVLKRLSGVDVLKTGFSPSKGWPYFKYVLDLSTDQKREFLFDNTRRLTIAVEVANKIIELAIACKEPLSGIEKLKK